MNWDERSRIAHETAASMPTSLPSVAHALGEGFSAQANARSGRGSWLIETPYVANGNRLMLDAEVSQDKPDRLVFGVVLPNDWYQFRSSTQAWPSITVAASRPASQMAREIERRLLLPAIAFFEQVAGSAKMHAEAKAGAEHTHRRLVAAGRGIVRPAPAKYPYDNQPRTQIDVSGAVDPTTYDRGYIRGYCHAKTVNLELCSLPVETAEAVLALLADLRDQSE